MDVPMTVVLERPVEMPAAASMGAISRMVGVGTATTGTTVSQAEVLDLFGIGDPRVRSVFLNSAIERRNLTLPEPGADGRRLPEPQGALLDKHKRLAIEMG